MGIPQVEAQYSHKTDQVGSAALEVLLLLPIMLLIFALMFNMGYNSERVRKTQAALRVGGFSYVDALTTRNRADAATEAEATVNSAIFRDEQNAADLRFTGVTDKPGCDDDANCLSGDQDLLGNASSRIRLSASVTRSPPYPSLVNSNSYTAEYVVSSNTWTFCEMKDENFEGLKVLNTFSIVGDYMLWLFGGCGGDVGGGCKDECP